MTQQLQRSLTRRLQRLSLIAALAMLTFSSSATATATATATANTYLNQGLIFLHARLYDPMLGRFLIPDPVADSQEHYSYTYRSPVNFEDVEGLKGTKRGLPKGTKLNLTEEERQARSERMRALSGDPDFQAKQRKAASENMAQLRRDPDVQAKWRQGITTANQTPEHRKAVSESNTQRMLQDPKQIASAMAQGRTVGSHTPSVNAQRALTMQDTLELLRIWEANTDILGPVPEVADIPRELPNNTRLGNYMRAVIQSKAPHLLEGYTPSPTAKPVKLPPIPSSESGFTTLGGALRHGISAFGLAYGAYNIYNTYQQGGQEAALSTAGHEGLQVAGWVVAPEAMIPLALISLIPPGPMHTTWRDSRNDLCTWGSGTSRVC